MHIKFSPAPNMDCQLHLRDDYTKLQALFFVVTNHSEITLLHVNNIRYNSSDPQRLCGYPPDDV